MSDKSPAEIAAGLSEVMRDIAAERQRQIEVEGWTTAHDDEHRTGQLAAAAACYAVGSIYLTQDRGTEAERGWPWKVWPWKHSWWKPANNRRNLMKAGALIIAEIERLDRAALNETTADGDGGRDG